MGLFVDVHALIVCVSVYGPYVYMRTNQLTLFVFVAIGWAMAIPKSAKLKFKTERFLLFRRFICKKNLKKQIKQIKQILVFFVCQLNSYLFETYVWLFISSKLQYYEYNNNFHFFLHFFEDEFRK